MSGIDSAMMRKKTEKPLPIIPPSVSEIDPMFEYRVTKYNPDIRRNNEKYTEWTSFGDVGKTFDGSVLTQLAYKKVESAYLTVASEFLREAQVNFLSVRGLEYRKAGEHSYREGERLSPTDVEAIMVKILREELWCRLEGDMGFIHFGWDYYMYIGVASACPKSEELAAKVGLFVEEMVSPYHPDRE